VRIIVAARFLHCSGHSARIGLERPDL
jgi:hypothetical protein